MLSDAERLVNLADEWLAEHRVSESWRVISALRDGLVRQVEASRPFTEEDVEAAAAGVFDSLLNMRWVEASENSARDYRRAARAALDAVTARHTKGDGDA